MPAKKIERATGLEEAQREAGRLGCAFIMIGHGKFALIDREDARLVQAFTWHWSPRRMPISGYVKTYLKGSFPNTKCTYLHRFILNTPEHLQVDHINRNGLDCRRCNMRECDRSRNCANSPKTGQKNRTGCKGVRPAGKRFTGRGRTGYKEFYLGVYDTPQEAARAYNVWAVKTFGEFACLNPV
jgi:hypothetical protein